MAHSANSVVSALAPTVVEAPASFTVSLPAVGALTFAVDPTTGLVSNAVATPLPASGFTAGAPVVTPKFVAVLFTSTTGATRVLIAQIHEVNGSVIVTAGNDRGLLQRIEHNRNDNRTPAPLGVTGPATTSATSAANAPKVSSTQRGSTGGSGSSSHGEGSNSGHSGED